MALPTPLQAFSGVPKNTASADKQTIIDGEKMTGAQALIRALEDLGVQDVFGLPGGAILPVFHAINDDTKFRFTLVRHEQAAGHAAEGYAVATGRVGVCIVTSGPGATNMITPIADANMDSVPLVVITGQVGVNAIGTDAFQEADIVGATYPVVKHSYLVTRAQDIPRVLAEAHYIARSGRPGPVVVDLTKTAQTGEMYYSWPQRMILPGYNPTTKAHGRVISDAAKLFAQSYRPVLYVGGGAVRSNASAEVAELAEVTGAPIVTTLPARGIVPNSNPKALGMLGMHGTVAATAAAQRCDREAEFVDLLRLPRHDGLRPSLRHRRFGRLPARLQGSQAGVADRGRRLVPDDFRRADDRVPGSCAGEDRHHQQLRVRHGAPVADSVLRAALLPDQPG